jgi:hypothetical protein
MALTDHAVHLSLVFFGAGIVPFFTFLQQEAAEIPYNNFNVGKRIKASSGKSLNFVRDCGIGFDCFITFRSIKSRVMRYGE